MSCEYTAALPVLTADQIELERAQDVVVPRGLRKLGCDEEKATVPPVRFVGPGSNGEAAVLGLPTTARPLIFDWYRFGPERGVESLL